MRATLYALSLCLAALVAADPEALYFLTHEALEASQNSTNYGARGALKGAADWWLQQGPYSLTWTKDLVPPSGDKRDFISFARYFWPADNCKNNRDADHTCRFVEKDGRSNPSAQVQSKTIFNKMCEGLFTLSAAFYVLGDEHYATKAVQFLDTWFINEKTRMNPSLKYSQVVRGPGEWKGRSYGVLDMRFLMNVGGAVQFLRKSSSWTNARNEAVQKWFAQYSGWLYTHDVGKQSLRLDNNHGTFATMQVASLKYFGGDSAGAAAVIREYLGDQFQQQIAGDGSQPLEQNRGNGLGYHYSIFNLLALTNIAKLGDAVSVGVWNATNNKGGSIRKAINHLNSQARADGDFAELYGSILSAASVAFNTDFGGVINKVDSKHTHRIYAVFDQPGVYGQSGRPSR